MRTLTRLLILSFVIGAILPTAFAGDIIPPRSIHRIAPIYPVEARLKQMTGVVEVVALIDENGNVSRGDVVKRLPLAGRGLEKATVDAVKQWKFEPARLDGNPVPVKFNLTIRYR